jgi:hypothetical protein
MRLTRLAAAVCVLVSAYACGGSSPATPSASPASKIIALSGNLAFGNVVAGNTTVSTLTISNSGSTSIAVTGLTVPSGYSASWTNGVIPAGGQQSVTISFLPTAAGTYNGTITVLADQTSGSNTVAVSGGAFPNLNGVWVGTERSPGFSTCDITWTVSGQTSQQFSGKWQNGGFSSQCVHAGSLTGTVSVGGAISNLNFGLSVGVGLQCSPVPLAGGLFEGPVTANSVQVQGAETLQCDVLGAVARSVTMSMTKQ